ncbi:AIR carboxylase family protein [Kaarinaea lacus]
MHTLVGVIMSSRSDWQAMKPATDLLARLRVRYEARIISSNSKPDKLFKYVKSASQRGLKMIIVSSNSAAELVDELASKTPLPVVCVPVASGRHKIIDSFLSFANLPAEFSMDAFTTGHTGVENAAFMAATMLSSVNPAIDEALLEYRQNSNIDSAAPKRRTA